MCVCDPGCLLFVSFCCVRTSYLVPHSRISCGCANKTSCCCCCCCCCRYFTIDQGAQTTSANFTILGRGAGAWRGSYRTTEKKANEPFRRRCRRLLCPVKLSRQRRVGNRLEARHQLNNDNKQPWNKPHLPTKLQVETQQSVGRAEYGWVSKSTRTTTATTIPAAAAERASRPRRG